MSNCNCSDFPNTFPYAIAAEDIVGDIADNVTHIAEKFGLTFGDLMPYIYACFPHDNPPVLGSGQVGTIICIPGLPPSDYVMPIQVTETEASVQIDYTQPVQTPDGLMSPPLLLDSEYILFYDATTYEFLIKNSRTDTQRIVRIWWPAIATPDGSASPPPLHAWESITHCDTATYTFHIHNHRTGLSRQVRVWWPSVATPDGEVQIPYLDTCEYIQAYDASSYTFQIINTCTGITRDIQVYVPCSYILTRNEMNVHTAIDLNLGEGESEQEGGGSYWQNFWQQGCGGDSANFNQACAEACFMDFFSQEIYTLLNQLLVFRNSGGKGGSSVADFLRGVTHINRILTTEQEWLDLAVGSYMGYTLRAYLENMSFLEIAQLYASLNAVASPEESDLLTNEAAVSVANAYLYAYSWEFGISLPFDAFAEFNPDFAYEDWVLRNGEENYIRDDLIAAIANIMASVCDDFGYLPELFTNLTDSQEFPSYQDVHGALKRSELDIPALIEIARDVNNAVQSRLEQGMVESCSGGLLDITPLATLNLRINGYDEARLRDKYRQMLYTPTWHPDYTGSQLDELQRLINEMPTLIAGVDVRFARAQMQRYINVMRQFHNWRVAVKPHFDVVENVMLTYRQQEGQEGLWLLLIVAQTGLSILFEPYDWLMTAVDLMSGDWSALIGLLPLVPSTLDDLARLTRNLPNISSLDDIAALRHGYELGDGGSVWNNANYSNLMGEVNTITTRYSQVRGYQPPPDGVVRQLDNAEMVSVYGTDFSNLSPVNVNDLGYGSLPDDLSNRASDVSENVIRATTGSPDTSYRGNEFGITLTAQGQLSAGFGGNVSNIEMTVNAGEIAIHSHPPETVRKFYEFLNNGDFEGALNELSNVISLTPSHGDIKASVTDRPRAEIITTWDYNLDRVEYRLLPAQPNWAGATFGTEDTLRETLSSYLNEGYNNIASFSSTDMRGRLLEIAQVAQTQAERALSDFANSNGFIFQVIRRGE